MQNEHWSLFSISPKKQNKKERIHRYNIDICLCSNLERQTRSGEERKGKSMLMKRTTFILLPNQTYIICINNDHYFITISYKKSFKTKFRDIGFDPSQIPVFRLKVLHLYSNLNAKMIRLFLKASK